MKTVRLISVCALVALVLISCAPSGGTTPTPAVGAALTPAQGEPSTGETAAPAAAHSGPVRVGSKDFTEELLLGEMYALILEDAGVPVERRLNLAGTQVAHEALLQNEIDLYPEYTGTAYGFILGIDDGEKDPETVYERTAEAYEEQWDLIWLEPAPMNDTNAIACTAEAAEQHNLQTLSDLAQAAPNIRFAAIPDFEQRPDGLAGLRELYGGFEFQEMTVYDPGLKYRALTEGRADCVIAFSTEGQISAYSLVLLEDDKQLWPPYQVAPVVRSAVLQSYPQVEEQLNALAPHITNETIAALNWQVDGDKQEYTQVARDFLVEQGLIQ